MRDAQVQNPFQAAETADREEIDHAVHDATADGDEATVQITIGDAHAIARAIHTAEKAPHIHPHRASEDTTTENRITARPTDGAAEVTPRLLEKTIATNEITQIPAGIIAQDMIPLPAALHAPATAPAPPNRSPPKTPPTHRPPKPSPTNPLLLQTKRSRNPISGPLGSWPPKPTLSPTPP